MAGVEISKEYIGGVEGMTRRMMAERLQAVQSSPPLYWCEEKKLVSRLGWRLVLLLVIMLAAANVMSFLAGSLAPNLLDSNYFLLIMNMVAQYCLAFPICMWLINKLPRTCVREQRLSLSDGVRLFFIGYFLMFLGNLLGMGVETFLSQFWGIYMPTDLDDFLNGVNLFAGGLVAVILAPIFEEMFFRKLLLDRLVKYGELPAVLASGILFGVYHGNFEQLFYALFLGIVFAYIYVKTGKIRYSIALHMLFNFNGLILASLAAEHQESMSASVYILVQLAIIIVGFILLIKHRKRVHFAPSEYDISHREGAAIIWLNPGMLTALLVSVMVFIGNLLFAV